MSAPFASRDRDRLVKTLKLLSSPIDGEVLAAGRTAHKLVAGLGGWEAVLVPPRPEIGHAFDWRQAAEEILISGGPSQWELQFCQSLLAKWRGPILTQRQEQTLKRIHENCCLRATA
jgi:hypothetical protein